MPCSWILPLAAALLLLRPDAISAAEPVSLSASFPSDPKATSPLTISRLEASRTTRGIFSETEVTLTLSVAAGEKRRTEGRLMFDLPPDCTVTGAALDIGESMRPASITHTAKATAAYESVVSQMLDPCLVRLLPDGRVSVQVFPITAASPRRLRLHFAQILTPSADGLGGDFPLTFSTPAAEARLIANDTAGVPPVVQTNPGFTGGASWRMHFPAPSPEAAWTAQPDGAGHFVFQGLLPAREPEAVRHLLVLADASRLQAPRNRDAERAVMESLLRRMGTGKVTLASFGTQLSGTVEFPVSGGKCDALFHALDSLVFDGAPRPGTVDVSRISTDLTLISSTLADPMGSGIFPKLPLNAPVLIMDSVSTRISGAVARFAAESGGMAFDPRVLQDPVFRQRPPRAGQFPPGTRLRLLRDRSAWLVAGVLPDSTPSFAGAGFLPVIYRGGDVSAGPILSRHLARENFLTLQPDASRSVAAADLEKAPMLTENTSFLVLEQKSDYEKFGVPLPPDLSPDPVPEPTLTANKTKEDDWWISPPELKRPLGTAGDATAWLGRLGGAKHRRMEERIANMQSYQLSRDPKSGSASVGREDVIASVIGTEYYEELRANVKQSVNELSALGGEYQKAVSPERAADAIQRGKSAQRARIKFMEATDLERSMFRSGGYTPKADPFAFPNAVVAASQYQGYADPFGGEDLAGGSVPEVAAPAHPGASPEGKSPAALLTIAESAEILRTATALHVAGNQSEAIRVLSNLVVQQLPDHGKLRLLAWKLLEWKKPALALEVLRQTERLFGTDDITSRDTALAAAAAGKTEEALAVLLSCHSGVPRREALGLTGKAEAGLRVVLECADALADADLEIDGPDYEMANWENPLPAFGGALSFDAKGFGPEDFVLPASALTALRQPLKIRVRLESENPVPVRVIIFRHWGQENGHAGTPEIHLLPECQPGVTEIAQLPPGG